ncbi:phosphotransferase [Sulfurovum sp. ST-21]|uniref:Phosphotransferase n=1 Tax=Sulfurovum indicum TaxID=2779528 RepID=A0A7M1S8I3_9BACT|nr:phosphotransferase [Sulfurovum indicum]QOR62640.1 phosphotransferase [Sulfurovum indicum]
MGIRTSITHAELPKRYRRYRLIPTENGVMATVYLLDDLYVLKLFEKETPLSMIENETDLLSGISGLPLPRVVERFLLKGRQAIVYTQIAGESIDKPTLRHISQIALFLKAFHAQSQNIKISCTKRFQRQELEALIAETGYPLLLQHFKESDLVLKKDGIIHGDLFPDNCKFTEGRLSGVYDLSDICLGDFHFDLAVVAAGWCFEGASLNEEKTETLLEYYGSGMDAFAFRAYIRYALLYYAAVRYAGGRDYRILLKRLERMI